MRNLHLIAQFNTDDKFNLLLQRYAEKGDPLLFIGEGVTTLLSKSVIDAINHNNSPSFALAVDCRCRGLEVFIPSITRQISDDEMVGLLADCVQVISW